MQSPEPMPTNVPTELPSREPTRKKSPSRNTKTHCSIPVIHHMKTRDRMQRRAELGGVAQDTSDLETACFADWSEHEADYVYWSWVEFAFVVIDSETEERDLTDEGVEEGYRAVTEDVPKSFAAALVHPRWGEPAKKEINTILSAKAMIKVNPEVARRAIHEGQADLMYLFPVYEEKIKEGVLVEKVRLVADGRTHHHAGQTYSATPSREEFFILMHIIAALDWDYAHVDEIRAFLNAPHKGESKAYVKFRGGADYYEVLGALYGLKTAPRHYQEAVAQRLETMGFKRLVLCSCIYIMTRGEDIVIIYDYVDDFIFTGSSRQVTESVIEEFRKVTATTEPIWDATRVLGMEL